jgi:F-type H+-transporting ATPase subunit delta
MLSVVATRYAKALVDVVTEPASRIDPPQALAELQSVDAIIAGSADLRGALLSPAVSPARKRAVVARLLEPAGVSKPVRNFVFVIIDHRRIHEFSAIAEAFEVLLDERLGYIRADVASARPLAESQRVSLEQQLSRLSGKKAKLKFTTDQALVAGILARVGSTVYDGSVRGQLERLRKTVAGNG